MDTNHAGQHVEALAEQTQLSPASQACLSPSMSLPTFAGLFSTQEAERRRVAEDFGHCIHNMPMAVLRPESFDDVTRLVQFARQHQLQIAPRGQGHSMYGQAQVEGGIVVDTSSLRTIHAIHSDRVEVEAGVLLRDLLRATLEHGLTLPVLPSYLGISVGGVLSVGGIGSGSHRYGAVVDNVLELQVVTGEGKLETCSANHQPDLFEGVLAGLGQCGIIVKATIRLLPAKSHARIFHLPYPTLTALIHDQERLLREDDGGFDIVFGYVDATPEGMWGYSLKGVKLYTPPADQPENDVLLRDLSFLRGKEQIQEVLTSNFVDQTSGWAASSEEMEPWYHAGLDVFVPTSSVVDYVHQTLTNIPPLEAGLSIILTPLKANCFHRPFLRLPETETFFLFDLIRTITSDVSLVKAAVYNRIFFERCRMVGGTHYPIGMIDLSPHDWEQHYGSQWETFIQRKQSFDPDRILTPGQGIFPQ